MATKKVCDLCGQEIAENQRSRSLKVLVTPLAERNHSEMITFARNRWVVDVCPRCAPKVAPHLGIDPLMKGGK